MCGIIGFLNHEGFDCVEASVTIGKMAGAVKHRGPDDSGQWLDGNAGIALGHRRLSVIDLTAAGHQPMESDCGRFILAFNGEIYNHLELRHSLGQWPWRGHSDTETLLAGVQQWGFERTLQQSTGMFAIALWDRDSQTLSLARDRMGEKPLYYGWQGKSFLFGSELKALYKHPDFIGDIDRSALALYVRRGYVPTPRSMFAGISKLIPGSILEIKSAGTVAEMQQLRTYWSLGHIITAGTDQRFNGQPDEAVSALEALLIATINEQQISDVPLGAFLSGGTDSSTVVALMQSISPVSVKTFTIGFDEHGYNEATYARAVAEHLKTEHTELYVSAKDAMEVIPDLPLIYDEPFADASQIPTVLVSRLARQHVTVALSGDGGDELFCGYGRYSQTVNTWSRLSMLPFPVRSALQHILPYGAIAEGIASNSIDEFYQYMNSQWKGYPNLVCGMKKNSTSETVPEVLRDDKERMMYTDALNYLPDDILAKVDRAAMSASLETRVPLLDHRIVEFAWQLPIAIK
ncbi:MAG: asparagine synthase (glutamine-hydrolyzing), partial [Nitrospirae bacterium]|nr:asparagine synthase (glutamine-hydrolyzing) [Nitrospirota bacterium]